MVATYFLEPGECCFFQEPKLIATVLGSCLAITAWHPKLKVGGMCHYLLDDPKVKKSDKNDFKYGCYALSFMTANMQSYASLNDYDIGMFGGSSFSFEAIKPSIGEKNINLAKAWLNKYQLSLAYQSVGGNQSRSLKLNLQTGLLECSSNCNGIE